MGWMENPIKLEASRRVKNIPPSRTFALRSILWNLKAEELGHLYTLYYHEKEKSVRQSL
jgi:hypothetical protein